MPSRVRRVSVRLLVNVGCRHDAEDREQNDPTGNSPATVRLGWYVAFDMVGHGGECSRTEFRMGAGVANPTAFALRKNCIPCATLPLLSVSQVLSGPNLGHSAAPTTST